MDGPFRYRYGYAVSGLGDDTNFPGGFCWYYGQKIPSALLATLDEKWIGGFGTGEGLSGYAQNVASTCRPYTASLSAGSHTIKLHYTTDVAETFFRPRPESAIRLTSGFSTPSEVNATFEGPSAATLSGTVVFLDDEAILVGTFSGGTSYAGCTRALFGTVAKPHFTKTVVYTRNPFLAHRRVRLLRLDIDTGLVSQRWQGVLGEDIRVPGNGTVLNLSATEVVAPISKGKVNRGARSLDPTAVSAVQTTYESVSGTVSHGFAEPKRVSKSSDETHRQWYQVQDSLALGTYFEAQRRSVIPIQKPTYGEVGEDGVERVFELFAIVRSKDEENDDTPRLTPQTNFTSPTRDLDYPFHPVAIWSALQMSDIATAIDKTKYNVLGYKWSGSVPSEWYDINAINAIIDADAHLKIDQMYLGWDGEEVSPWDVFKPIFTLFGYFPGRSSDGRVRISRLRQATTIDLAGAPFITIYPNTLDLTASSAESTDVISGAIGKAPWTDGVPYSVESLDDVSHTSNTSLRGGFFAQADETKLDIDIFTDPNAAVEQLSNLIDQKRKAIPRFKFKTELGDYHHGQFVVFNNPEILVDWFVDSDGVVTDLEENYAFIGMVVGINESTRAPFVELEVLLTNYDLNSIARLRAPSAVVVSVASNVVTIEGATFTQSGGDGKAFAVGDVVEVWTNRGARRSGTAGTPDAKTISVAGGATLTLSGAFSTAPQAGDIIRIAQLDDVDGYPEDGVPAAANGFTLLNYVFAADGSETIAPTNLPAHVYSTGVI